MFLFRTYIAFGVAALCGVSAVPLSGEGFVSKDLYRFRSVNEVQFSPDNRHLAYAAGMYDRPGGSYSQIWLMDVASQKSMRVGGEKEEASHPRWSPDGKMIAYTGSQGDKHGLMVMEADGSGQTFLAATSGSNSPLPGQGESFTWSPDSKTIAFVSATPGPETEEASGDPMVITRYLYKPTASEGLTHFNDNKRLHIFSVDLNQTTPEAGHWPIHNRTAWGEANDHESS